jgi:hypothetical protein|tara:strand:+ start:1517 stop:2017 length:501 start_codon:yes stop_codon:yes gene_type:complete
VITLDITNDWNLVDIDNISGRLNVMWLSPEGIGISTRVYSHMTILNMILEKSDILDFWDIEEIKKHNIDDVIQLGKNKKDFKNNNLELAELMENFMVKTNFVRISGPYREVEFGGSNFGHASKLLENRHFVYEYCKSMTKKQKDFVDKVIDVYNLADDEIQEVKHD